MRNRYPKSCGVCLGWVPAGEGIAQKVQGSGWISQRVQGSDWVVTHDVCPKGSERHGHAQAYARRTVTMLRRRNSTADDITEALDGLAALMRTGWTSRENCEKIILKAPAFDGLDRLEVEEILDRCLTHEGTRC